MIVSGEMALGGIFLASYMSVIRRIKGKRVWKSSLCYSIVQSCKKVYMARKTSGRMITWAGTMLFIASDTILSFQVFHKKSGTWVMPTYLAAQFLIVLGALM